jgi:hypothetical protein
MYILQFSYTHPQLANRGLRAFKSFFSGDETDPLTNQSPKRGANMGRFMRRFRQDRPLPPINQGSSEKVTTLILQ